jgi:hypothetical protein
VDNDITSIVANTLQQCVDACSTMNHFAIAPKCKAVMLNENLASTYSNNHRANCWLKSVAGSEYRYDTDISTVVELDTA